jgi:dTDP-glucose 4,6-dehydratase
MYSILITGGAGFIGSHMADKFLSNGDKVIVYDRLSTGGSLMNLEQHAINPNLEFVRGDVTHYNSLETYVKRVDYVIHAAAESHVDRSIDSPVDFMRDNVLGAVNVLDAVKAYGKRLLMISTDEVYGPGNPRGGTFDEKSQIAPASPYAVSKASADLLALAYHNTYGIDVTVVRGTNAYGPRQVEKVMPTYIVNALNNNPIPVYGKGNQRREFLYVTDWADAAWKALSFGSTGEVYNIGEGTEIANIDLAKKICELTGASEDLIKFVPDRLGHDFRYGLNSEKIKKIGFMPKVSFEDGLKETIEWYRGKG